jgi:hypothetical protein
MRLGELLTHDVNRAADVDEESSSERVLQDERNVSRRVQCVLALTVVAAKQIIYYVETRPGPKPGEIVKRGVRGVEAYQSAVGMLSSDGCTQSNGVERDADAASDNGVVLVEGARLERKSWCASACCEERGLRRDWGATSKKWALDQKSPLRPQHFAGNVWLLRKTQKLVLEQSVCVQAAIDKLQLWLQEIVVLWCCTRREQSRTVAGPKGELSRVTLAP